MKKLLCITLALMLLLCACGTAGQSNAVQEYQERALALIEEGDYDAAIVLLERGVTETGSATLKRLLERAIALRDGETTVTTAATEPAPTLRAVQLTRDTQYELNIFLSNFAEQDFNLNDPRTGDVTLRHFTMEQPDYALIAFFVLEHCRINVPSRVTAQGNGGYAISTAVISEQAQRFFGISVSENQLEESGLILSGGKLQIPYEPATSWRFHAPQVAVAEEMYVVGDGSYLVEFVVYAASGSYVKGNSISGKDVYYLSGASAASDYRLTRQYCGTARVVPYNMSGRQTFQLLEYTLDGQS